MSLAYIIPQSLGQEPTNTPSLEEPAGEPVNPPSPEKPEEQPAKAPSLEEPGEQPTEAPSTKGSAEEPMNPLLFDEPRGEPLKVLTLQEAVDFTIRNKPSLDVSRSAVSISETDVTHEKSSLYPKVDFRLILPLVQRESRIAINQLIWDFGKTRNRIKAKKEELRASKFDLKSELSQAVLDTKIAYYTALAEKHNFEASQKMSASKQKRAEQMEAFYKLGRASKLDVTRAKVDAGKAKLETLRARNNMEKARLELAKAIGWEGYFYPPLEDMLEYKPIYFELDPAVQRAIERRPEIKSLLAKQAGMKADERTSLRKFFPDIVGRAAYRFDGSGARGPDAIAGVGFRMPIFQGLSRVAGVKKSRALRFRTNSELRALRQKITAEVKELYLNLEYAKQSIIIAHESENSAQENYETVSEKYRLGTSSEVELLDAEALLESTKAEYARTIYDYKTVVAELERAIGEKLEE